MKRITKILTLVCFIVFTTTQIKAQKFELPKYSTFELKNGLKVYLMEQHDVPVMSVSAILPAGAIYDDGKSGLASLSATALKHGTKNYSKSKIDETLDYIGANVSVSASKEFASLSSKFAAKDQKVVLSIIKELLVNPIFNADEFEKEKSRLLVELERQKESPQSVIRSYFDELLYDNHVYANNISGTISSVEKLTITDVKSFYTDKYAPNNAAISIVGDFNSKEMKKVITTLFSDWKKGNTTSNNVANKAIKTPTKNNVLLVNKEDANETTFYIGAPGVAKNNKDNVAIEVINTLFGGRFTSMLNSELRVNSGLTYGARSNFINYKYGGSFLISTFTENKSTEQAIDLALEVLNRLHGDGLTEELLTSAKNYVKGQFPPDYETTGQLSNLLTQMFWYDFNEDFINNFEKNVDELDFKKAQEIIATYFPKDTLQFVLIGKASEIEKITAKYGTVKKVDIKD
jgi:predicted Zn-dependent peptidase